MQSKRSPGNEMGMWRLRLCPAFVRRHKNTNSGHADKSPSLDDATDSSEDQKDNSIVPNTQTVLLLRVVKGRYEITPDFPLPKTRYDHEVLVRTTVIGLNPIDWKAPDFNFGIPELPYISGREIVGEVVDGKESNRLACVGERVLVISTDYRDVRKSGFQQYVIGSDFNIVRLPPKISSESAAGLGVAYVAAALSLGICAGLDFSHVLGGPNLLNVLRKLDPLVLPEDVRAECRTGIARSETMRRGDWVALWGGSSTSAFITCQLARLAGVRVISVLDVKKHGRYQAAMGTAHSPDALVDSHDTERAIEIVRATTSGRLRFGLDFVGRETASYLLESLSHELEPSRGHEEPPASTANCPVQVSQGEKVDQSHLIGLTGLPKSAPPSGCVYHTVPIKVFHEVPAVGKALVVWLERLLSEGLLQPPSILHAADGLGSINSVLDRMRRGEISGGRAVVRLVT